MSHEAFLSDGSLIPRTGPTHQSCQAHFYPDAPNHSLDASDISRTDTSQSALGHCIYVSLYVITLSLHQEHHLYDLELT